MSEENLVDRSDCQECENLWKAYASSTNAHIRLAGKLQIAELQHTDTAELREEVCYAEKARTAARVAIHCHEHIDHGIGRGNGYEDTV